jgi:hypothetical protein
VTKEINDSVARDLFCSSVLVTVTNGCIFMASVLDRCTETASGKKVMFCKRENLYCVLLLPLNIIVCSLEGIKIRVNNNNNNNNNKPIYEEGAVTVLWNQAVHTERKVTANRPDIIIINKKEKACTLIDVAIPADRNVVQKEAEKKLKCKSLCIEIQRMWNLKCSFVPVIIGATGEW